jgi:hypothetical protein
MPTELEQLFEKYMQAPKVSSPEEFLRSVYSFMPNKSRLGSLLFANQKLTPQNLLPANRTMEPAEASRRWEDANRFSMQGSAWNKFLQQILQDELGIQWPPHQW